MEHLCIVYVPFRYFSPTEYLVISLPETPQVPMPTRPFTFSGEAKILLIFTCPDFLAPFDEKFSHLFLSTSRSSSSSLERCCFRCFFFFKYSLLFGRCRLQVGKIRQEKINDRYRSVWRMRPPLFASLTLLTETLRFGQRVLSIQPKWCYFDFDMHQK